MPDLFHLPVRDKDGNIHVVVETPQGARVKQAYDPMLDAIVWKKRLPVGVQYPYDWGFIPGTRAGDGDPLDAMVLADSPSWPGVVIPSIPIGVVRLLQRSSARAKPVPNHRIIAVPIDDPIYTHIRDLSKRTRSELEAFFFIVGSAAHAEVTVTGWEGAKSALAEIGRAERTAKGS